MRKWILRFSVNRGSLDNTNDFSASPVKAINPSCRICRVPWFSTVLVQVAKAEKQPHSPMGLADCHFAFRMSKLPDSVLAIGAMETQAANSFFNDEIARIKTASLKAGGHAQNGDAGFAGLNHGRWVLMARQPISRRYCAPSKWMPRARS